MKLKQQLFNFSLWWSVVGASIWVGGTVYMMLVINPQWSSNPPMSVRHFFKQTDFNKYIWYFFGPPFMILRSILPQLLSFILSWSSKVHRRYLTITLACSLITVIFTIFYIYPINEVLLFKAGGNNSDEAIKNMAATWLLADRIRFIINIIGYYFLLKAFRVPFTQQS